MYSLADKSRGVEHRKGFTSIINLLKIEDKFKYILIITCAKFYKNNL